MTFTTTSSQADVQSEIARQRELAKEISSNGRVAAISKLWHSKRRFSVGVFFPANAVIGQVFQNEDGSRHEVVEIVAT